MAAVAFTHKLPHPRSSSKGDWSYQRSHAVEKPHSNHLGRQRNSSSQIFWSVSRNRVHISSITPLYAALNRPKGFGPPPRKAKSGKKQKPGGQNDEDDDDDDEDDREAGVIPEIVTNRMIGRMAFTVGIPLFVGLLFFPFFYYLKVGLKIDVPTWVPVIVSFIFFGTALLGVSYGIVSSSWDPLREGSLLGWNEAQKNWPVFWQSFRGSSGKR